MWSFSTNYHSINASLSRALALYYPLAGEILWNADARENQIHCNNRGVDFVEAVADVQLKELNLYNPDESIEGKLMPKKLHGVLAIQVTELNCGGIVIDITRSETPSMLPSFDRSYFNPRFPTTYSSSIDDVFAILEPPTKPDPNQNQDEGDLLINRVYFIEGEQLSSVQTLACENECRRSKLEAFASFLWKIIALSMEDSRNSNKMCNVALAVDGRRRLSEGDGEEKEKLMISHFGNVLSIPSGAKRSQELKEMSLSEIATVVHEFLQIATTKEHFLDLIDWVEERRSQPLIARAFASGEMAVMISSGSERSRLWTRWISVGVRLHLDHVMSRLQGRIVTL
ncbi:shikimate O-hydroxycinnamoyltransferase-like protein [Tanacetum coccineum]